ncbi:hypothetical protein [Methylobacterium indicum]|uniref:Uncharacterized protein n=1 Tax=Methylobacterium indicum TaxID=1775910 RepID=A0A8H9C697_9HYPH|nr:hypothetical protein [Methylobacterium indicum]BCM83566.1 hypothetical protein mvi_20270 [Methylobacterium indicum]
MPQAAPRFSDADLAAAVDAGEDLDAFAARHGQTSGWVRARLRKLRIARGEAVKESGDFPWEEKLRFQPTRQAVERLYLTHGREAVEERWGRGISRMRGLKLA